MTTYVLDDGTPSILDPALFRDPDLTLITALEFSMDAANEAVEQLLRSRRSLLAIGFRDVHPICKWYDRMVNQLVAQADGDRRAWAAECDRIVKTNIIALLTRQV